MFNLMLAIGEQLSLRIAINCPRYEMDDFIIYLFALRVGEFQIYKRKMRRLK